MKLERVDAYQATEADWQSLRESGPSDFDGHTQFGEMSPAARLAWLDDAVLWVAENAKRCQPPRAPRSVAGN
jgi:hypothetical protein